MIETSSLVSNNTWAGGEEFLNWETSPCNGCGACCKDVKIVLSELASTPDELFGDLLPYVANPYDPLDLKDIPDNEGIYYAIGKTRRYLVVIGQCPELNVDSSCNIHNGRRPLGCIISGTDSLKCIANGIVHGHTPKPIIANNLILLSSIS